MRITQALFGLVLISGALLVSAADYDDFTNTRIKKRVEATSQVVRHTVAFEYESSGGSKYHLTLQQPSKLAYLNVTDSAGKELETTFVEESKAQGLRFGSYLVQLPASSGKFKYTAVYTNILKALPAKISQNEKQYMVLEDNHYVVSPYKTNEQTTTVELSSDRIESKTEQSPTSANGRKITYGPYNNIKPFTSSPLRVHYENNSPFITVKKFYRTVEISHWGNIAVEDSFDITHTGALLKTSFNRADYQRNPHGSPSHIPKMKEILPAGAADVYYRDNIGNISTSNFNEFSKPPTLEFQPRTPLFGGWRIKFEIGYNLPTEKYLYRDYSDSSRYVLNISAIAALEDATFEEVTVTFILPEGVRNADVTAPFPVESQSNGKHYTYLDTSGRQTLTVTKKNLVSDYNTKNLSVSYHFSRSSLLQEPILLISTWFTFFLFIMGLSRFRYNIGPKTNAVVVVPAPVGRQ